MNPPHRSHTSLVIPIPENDDRWLLDEEDMPESTLHAAVIHLLVDIFWAWIKRTKRDAAAGRNLAWRWNREKPTTGADPDVYLVEPAPPGIKRLRSLRTWLEGHHPPRVVIEVVSHETSDKDYYDAPARYAVGGANELWVFDPLKIGPKDGPAFVLQVWRRVRPKLFKCVYQGDGPAFSRELGAWLVVTEDGERLRIADDAAGTKLWPTEKEEAIQANEEAQRASEEAQRASEEAQRAREEALRGQATERAAREAAEREVAKLRAQLSRAKSQRNRLFSSNSRIKKRVREVGDKTSKQDSRGGRQDGSHNDG
jgi:Uma2 family endonuclease